MEELVQNQSFANSTSETLQVSSNQGFMEMERNKSEFLATFAHELRNPVAPIKSGLQLLAFMNLSPDVDALRTMMSRQLDQIVQLVEDLLDVARIRCGKLILNKSVMVMKTAVETAVEQTGYLLTENGMTVRVIDESKAACVFGDPVRLTQVLYNLLNNAAKFGRKEGTILVTMTVRGNNLLIDVQDDGMGIEASRLKDIFSMYAQIESRHSSEAAGLGIGLSLVRSLVELHGGTVDANSEGPGHGATFTVSLPICASALIEHASEHKGSEKSSRAFRVLVVDDQRAMRTVSTKLLQAIGHEVRSAENGATALEILKSFHADVVFSDVTMPVMGGYELASRIRDMEDLNSVCLVALTGYGRSSDKEKALQAGFDRHFTKPINLQQLKDFFDDLHNERQQQLKSTDSCCSSMHP